MTTTTLPGVRRGRSSASPLLHIDGVFVASTIMLAGLGVLMVFSATRGPGGPANPTVTSYLVKQTGFVVLGFAAMAFAAAIDYRRIRDLAPLVYGGTLFVLVAVLSPVGSASKGAQAWFQVGPFQLQPSEFGKVAVILVLAAYVSRRDGDLQLRHLLTACVLAGVPMALIMLQPDLGTVLVFVAITTGILLVGGARPRHILIVAIIGIAAVVGILNSNLLAQYQKDRLAGFLNPTADVRGSTYNIDQSQITIGAGGVLGRGLFKGPQTRSGQVPEQQTDFIFTVVGEELGFVGAATVLFLYAVLLWRIWRTAKLSRDLFGSLLCVGVFAMILFQLFESVGMTAGIMPVTGIPLPLMSYGGSATVAEFIGLGLVLNVHMRRFA